MAREGRTISLRAGGRPSAVAPRALASGSRRWAAQPLEQGPQIRRAGGRAGSAAPSGPGPPAGVVLGPQPVRAGARDRDPGRDAAGADDHAPVLAVGVGRVRARGCEYRPRRPGRHRRAARPGSRPARRPRPPARRDPGRAWSGTRPGRCWPARAGASGLRIASARSAWSRPLGVVSTSLSSRSSSAVNSRRRARSAGVSRWSWRAASSSSRPRPRSSSSACHASAGRPSRASTAARAGAHGSLVRGAFQAGEGDPEPGRVQALDRTQPRSRASGYFPWALRLAASRCRLGRWRGGRRRAGGGGSPAPSRRAAGPGRTSPGRQVQRQVVVARWRSGGGRR